MALMPRQCICTLETPFLFSAARWNLLSTIDLLFLERHINREYSIVTRRKAAMMIQYIRSQELCYEKSYPCS